MAKALNSSAIQTATKTQVKVSTAVGIGAAVLTAAALMSFFSVLAATSIWNLGQIKSDFGYESHILFGNDDYYPSAGEYGTVYNLTHEWKTVKFLRDYGTEAPVVIAQPLSFKGGQPSHIRIKNVTPTSFDLKIEEWGYMDGYHAKEDVSFIVWPQHIGFSSDNGFLIDSGFVDANQEWTDIPLSSLFKERLDGATPIIFTQSQTFNGGDPIVTRNKTVNNIPEFIPPATPSSLYGKVVKSASMPEGLYYVGYNSNTQKYARYYFPYLDPRPTRPLYQDNEYLSWYMDKNNVLTISDTEMAGYPIAGNVTFRPGTKLIKLDNNLKIWAVEPGGILRELKINYNVLYGRDFINRVQVIPDAFFVNYTAGKEWTDQTKHPDGTLVQYVSSSDIYLISNGQKRKFTGNSFAVNRYKDEYIVKNVDPNIFVYDNGNDILGGEKELLNIAGQIPPVSLCKDSDGGNNYYIKGTASKPGSSLVDICTNRIGETYTYTESCSGSSCYLQEAYCDNNKDIVTSIAYVCPLGCGLGACVSDKTYQTRLQEEEAKGAHVIEKVGYIAIKPFSGIFTFGNQKIEVGSIGNATHNWTLIPFRQNFENAPAFLAHTQTFNGGDTVGLRYKELDNLKAYVKLEEERSKDTEINHIAETVGYIAISRPVQVIGKLNVSLAGDPIEQKVMAGTKNFTFANLIFDAADSTSDLQVSQVKVTIATGNGGFPANLSNSTLWDGNIQLRPANDPDFDLNITTPGASTTVIFTLSSPLTISAGTSKTLTYKANISSAAVSGAEISAGIQPGAEPAVQDAAGNKVSPSVSYSAGPKMTVQTSGTLTLSSATSPSDSLAAGGQAEEVFKFTLAAAGENMTITQGYINVNRVNSAGGIRQISELKIYDGPALVASGIATSTDNADRAVLVSETGAGSWALAAGQTKTYTVKATTRIPDYYNQVVSGTATIAISGQAVDFSLKAGDLTVNGAFSGELGAGSKSGTADASNFYVFKAIPKITPNDQLPSGEKAGGTLFQVGNPGANLYKFKVTAIGADVGLYNFTFYISTTTATVTQSYKLYDGGVPVAAAASWMASNKYIPNNGIGGAGVLSMILTNDGAIPGANNVVPLTVYAGTTKTFTLKGDIICVNVGSTCGAAVGSGMVVVSMLGNTAAPGVGMQKASTLPGVNQWNTVGVGGASFLWTDYWRTYNNASTTASATEQWWNGYRIRDLANSVLMATSTSAVWSR